MNVLDIEFRGKRVDNGEWVYGDLTRYSGDISYITVDLIENEVHEVHTNTVGMYTGLKDKNGVRLFSGDYLGNETTYKMLLDIEDGHTCVKFKAQGEKHRQFIIQPEIDDQWFYILGNVYDEEETR